jgi:hypothetical protein
VHYLGRLAIAVSGRNPGIDRGPAPRDTSPTFGLPVSLGGELSMMVDDLLKARGLSPSRASGDAKNWVAQSGYNERKGGYSRPTRALIGDES